MATQQESKINIEEINILLLGETGVGKSTFINSFANYLEYKVFEEAVEAENLLIIIPTVINVINENKESVSIRIGSDKNEYQEAGASGTQDVKTYVFPLNEGKTRIRLIDTPGMGDPRGIRQDDINCENILTYLSQLKELHAICFLMKPTTTRKTIFFEYCVKQILSKLEKSASRNIIFVFTNTRGSNYTPGDTVPCLKAIIDDIKSKPPYVEVPLNKFNLFCLDNEAFRFLIATKNNFQYSEDEKERFTESWYRSVGECARLMSYVAGDESHPPITPHQLQNTISVNEVRRTILQLSQPLSEITQLIHDNIRCADRHKQNLNIDNRSLQQLKGQLYIPVVTLKVEELPRPVTVCTSPTCAELVQVGFVKKWHYGQRCHNPCSLKNVPKELIGDKSLRTCSAMSGREMCRKCKCSYTVHMHIYYETTPVDTRIIDMNILKNIRDKEQAINEIENLINEIDKRKQELEEEHEIIVTSTAQFAHFLQYNAITPYNDSYTKYIKYLIDRENSLGPTADSETIQYLEKLETQYEEIKTSFENSLQKGETAEISTVTTEEVLNTINKLYGLKHNGQKIQELFSKQDISRQNEHSERCEYVQTESRKLSDMVNRKVGKNIGTKGMSGNQTMKKKATSGQNKKGSQREGFAHNMTNTNKNNKGGYQVNQEKVTDALVYMVAVNMIPYDVVGSEEFKFVMKAVNPSFDTPSTTVVERRIIGIYSEIRDNIIKNLRSITSVCLTIHYWTSISEDSYLTLTAHYIDNHWNLKSACLGCRYVAEHNAAEYLCEIIRDTLDQYDLTRKVIACTTDAKDNLLMEAIDMLHFTHITCLGYSINSVIRQSIGIDAIKNTLGKVEDIYNYFCKCSKAGKEFNKIQQELGVKKKNFPIYSSKKWWPILQLLTFCEDQHKAIAAYVLNCIEPLVTISENVASENVITASIILPIVEQILANAKHDNLSDTLEENSETTEKVDTAEKVNNKEVFNTITIATQFSKILREIFGQRYNNDSETCNKDIMKNTLRFLMKAMFLDPRFKNNHPDVAEIYESLKDESKQYTTTDELVKVPKKKFGLGFIFGSKQESCEVKKENLICKEFEFYTNLKNIDVSEDPLMWWKNNESRFPYLAFLARKYLAGQAASGSSDCIFLKNGTIKEDARASFSGHHVEQMVYISLNKNYFKQQ